MIIDDENFIFSDPAWNGSDLAIRGIVRQRFSLIS